MRNSLDYAGLAQLCARSPIMRKIMRAHNHIIQPSLALRCECSMPAEQSVVLNVMNNCNFLRMLDLLAVWTVWHCKIEISSHHESALWVTLYCFCTSAVAVCAWRHQYLFYSGIFPTRNWICAIYFCHDLLVGLLITACRCHCTHCLMS